MSGTVKSSDATELWNEARSIREWSADRISQLTGVVSALETRIRTVEDHNIILLEENAKLLDTINTLRLELLACQTAVESLTGQLKKSEDRVEVLEDEAKEAS